MSALTRRAALSAAAALPALAVLPPARAAAPAAAPPAGERPLFGASLWTLPNGLTVVHAENRRAPVVAHYVFYSAGAGEDPAGRSGLAHFLEHMMFKGSPNVPSGAFSRLVAREGGQDNAFTSRDVTAYHQHVEAGRLDLVAGMEADRMAAALFPADEIEPERQVVQEERRQRTESTPRGRFRETWDAAFWGRQHWRGRPLIGWPEDIAALSRDDMLDFFGRYYVPANATLLVTGAVSREAVARMAEQHYGAIPSRPAPHDKAARDRAPAPGSPLRDRLVQREATLQEAAFLRGWVAPSQPQGQSQGQTQGQTQGGAPAEHVHPLEVLAHLLGGGQGSRLHKALVQSGLAVSAGCAYDGDAIGTGSLEIFATPRRETTTAALEGAVAAEVARLLDGGVTEAEVARSIRQLTAGVLLALDSLGAAPRILGGALANGLPLESVEFWPARIRAVTPPQVEAAARAVLSRPSMTGWLLPEGAA
ncbi:pitrilysin family protein [Roseomonas sp. KE0001]|uniref:M16 family metallopeptidase n=1 Tax=Roseomonas sp. KE0001 TaxID=2479201 RepID=UPI0018DF31DA|nr:pitrilysin family protein [Roseomonas sp. KE0001]MBI0433198.1 insulinase family protein [Roseomonas sp. KE0001]